MQHTYYIQDSPLEFGLCDRPTWFVYADGNHVHTYCEDGHHIVSHIYPTRDAAQAVMKRARRMIETRLLANYSE
jgi:hypothetical protein